MQTIQYDYILIWSHGLQYKNEIIDLIAKNKDFEIIKIQYHHPQKIKNLVKTIYSYDYAPFKHLKAKTKYLKKTASKVFFIFIKNKNPKIDYKGEGSFRHSESMTLKVLKEEIRNKFNPYNNGKRTEDHIIHASDNEAQTNYILKYLGYKNGLNSILSTSKILRVPYHIGKINSFHLKKIKLSEIYCTILHGTHKSMTKRVMHITETPHYKTLSKQTNDYQKYLETFQGYYLTDYYSIEKFLELEKKMSYLEEPYSDNYIIVKKIKNNYIIQDGVHRACILQKRNKKEIIVAVI